MKFLVFDTCFNRLYIVLREDDNILYQEIVDNTEKNYHSVFLVPKIRDIFKLFKIQLKDIDCIGVNIGPGSFTGIRAGLTVARVLAQQSGIKLIGIPSLEILSHIVKSDKRVCVLTDARKNKVYYASYKSGETLSEPAIINKNEIKTMINNEDILIADSSITDFLKDSNISCLNYENNNDNLGIYLSEIVKDRLNSNNDDFHWAKVKPLYIQPPSITKPKEYK